MENNWSIDQLQEAWKLASRYHKGQEYGGPNEGEYFEYINHIGGVTFEVLHAIFAGSIDQPDLAIKCAVLHDTIEDTDFSEKELENIFGAAVAKGVLALTKNDNLDTKEEKMLDSLRRVREQPKAVWAVKMADRIVNLSEPPFYWKNEKKIAYQKEAQLILEALREGNAFLAARLSQKIEAYGNYIDWK